jgi:hypothetical protein
LRLLLDCQPQIHVGRQAPQERMTAVWWERPFHAPMVAGQVPGVLPSILQMADALEVSLRWPSSST